MKKSGSLVLGIVTAGVLSVCSCGGFDAGSLDGSWIGEPKTLDSDSLAVDIVTIYSFEHIDETSGRVDLSAMLSAEKPLTDPKSGETNGWIDAASLASIQGRYSLRDDNLYISLDADSYRLVVDNDAVRVSSDFIDAAEDIAIDSSQYNLVRDSCTILLRRALHNVILSYLTCDSLFTDIQLSGNLFSAKTPDNSNPLTFRRQPQ